MDYFAEIPPMELPNEMVRITEHILETKREDFDPAWLEDRYRTVLVEKLREKQAQMPTRSLAPSPSPQNVINLMDALKRSLAAEQPHTQGARKGPEKSMPRRAAPASKSASSKRSTAPAKRSD
jgi:DNA end-binding protein Ku